MTDRITKNQDGRITAVQEITHIPIGELAQYRPYKLYELQEAVNQELLDIKKARQWLEAAINLKYEKAVSAKRLRLEKESGVIHIDDEDYRITCDIKKKVTWEQGVL